VIDMKLADAEDAPGRLGDDRERNNGERWM
jgi:hypothetical protein